MGDEAEYLDDTGDFCAWRYQQERESGRKNPKPKGERTVNTTGNEALTVHDSGYSIMPRNMEAQINEAVAMRNALNQLFEKLLELGKDFDRIPGTDKPTLLKPGAEILCKVFKFAQGKADVLDKSEDWEKGVFSYTIGMPLIHIDSGMQIAYGIGAANSMEKKHRYRSQEVNGQKIQIENPDPADLQNTLIKMANKRAFVDAVLKATGASRMFTQDMEDFGATTRQFEKASSKQLDFVRKLFGSASEPEAMAEISGIVGREVKTYGDIYRSEASRIIDAKKSSGGGAPPARGNSAPPAHGGGAPPPADGDVLACADCGEVITKAEYDYSGKRYGRPLCRGCQNNETVRGGQK
jgi:hypothetical protein